MKRRCWPEPGWQNWIVPAPRAVPENRRFLPPRPCKISRRPRETTTSPIARCNRVRRAHAWLGVGRSSRPRSGATRVGQGRGGRGVGSWRYRIGRQHQSAGFAGNTAAGLTAPGGLIGIDSNSSGVDTPDRVQTAPPNLAVPELHVVQNGDTLWSLCSKYFGDPWRWPRLWAANPVITNPHWIFPGDVIRLGEQSGAVAPPAAKGFFFAK